MVGTLELLCGPSGVGKSSGMGKKLTAYTYTTRPIRPDQEIDGVDRIFVDDDTFEYLKGKGEIFVDYNYLGHKYGYSTKIIEEVLRGKNISEQIVPIDGFIKVHNALVPFIPIEKKAFLSNISDIELRLKEGRSIREQKERLSTTPKQIIEYVNNVGIFDEVVYVLPNKMIDSQIKKIAEAQKEATLKYPGKYIEYNEFAYSAIRNASPIMIGNPLYFENLLHLISVARKVKELDKDTSSDVSKEGMMGIFGINSIMTEIGDYSAMHRWMDKSINEIASKDYSKNKFIMNIIANYALKNIFIHSRNLDTKKRELHTGMRAIHYTGGDSVMEGVNTQQYVSTTWENASAANIRIKMDLEMLKIYQNYHRFGRFYDLSSMLMAEKAFSDIKHMVYPVIKFENYKRTRGEEEAKSRIDTYKNNTIKAEPFVKQRVTEMVARGSLTETETEYRIIRFPMIMASMINDLDLSIWAYSINSKNSNLIKEKILPYIKEHLDSSENAKIASSKYITYAFATFLDRLKTFNEMKENNPTTIHDDYSPLMKMVDDIFTKRTIPETEESKIKIIKSLNELK